MATWLESLLAKGKIDMDFYSFFWLVGGGVDVTWLLLWMCFVLFFYVCDCWCIIFFVCFIGAFYVLFGNRCVLLAAHGAACGACFSLESRRQQMN